MDAEEIEEFAQQLATNLKVAGLQHVIPDKEDVSTITEED